LADETTLDPAASDPSDIARITIEEEMQRSYLDYAMSVIVARALPDVRDGLKPVHRRILYAMKEGGFDWNRAHRKSAKAVGEVMGNYHPHGDTAIYDTMVRLAQPWSMRLKLVDGQGNFGSVDGDPPAAQRYTESRLTRAASQMLDDIDKDTVDFQPNYDESTTEPVVLPTPFPNLLVNGGGGIAVGMATNIPTHNLGEVIEAAKMLLENPGATIDELMTVLPGPDFPTGALILGRSGIRSAYHTGRGSVMMRAATRIETFGKQDREAIVIDSLPYQVNKAKLVEKISELAKEKTVEGISECRDESDREGMRVVIELKRDAQADVVLAQLFRYTQMQTSFGVNMLAIDQGRPKLLNLKEVLAAFLDFRFEVVTRRTAYLLNQARDRAHILVGLAVAVANIDEIIALIRNAPDPVVAREQLMARHWPAEDIAPMIALLDDPQYRVSADGTYQLSEAQARGILDLRLQRLTGLEREKISDELEELAARIKDYLDILSSRERVVTIIREEMDAYAAMHGDGRRTLIEDIEFDQDIEELIPREDMVVTVSHAGYVKRVPLDTYRAQRRGGKGRSSMTTKDEDFVTRVLVCNTHTPVLFFSSMGKVYKTKVYKLPAGAPQARGKPFVNILPLEPGETITTFLPIPEDAKEADGLYLMFATSTGMVRRNALSDFERVQSNGKIAMKLDEGEQLIGVQIAREDQDLLLGSAFGKAMRFAVSDVRVFQGRDSRGVRGIKLAAGDHLISTAIIDHVDLDIEERDAYLRRANAIRRASEGEAPDMEAGPDLTLERFAELSAHEQRLLAVANDGFGKQTSAFEYRVTGRGGQGVEAIDLSRGKAGRAETIALIPVTPNDQLMLVTDGGKLIRMGVDEIRVAGRSTRGVTLFRIADDERIVSVARLEDAGNEEAAGDESEAGTAAPEGGDDNAA
jgi:DNA gyrase subunit A